MFSVRFSRLTALALVAAGGLLPGCGGGGSGPSPGQANPTSAPTTAPLASGRIAWASDRSGGVSHLFVMNGDGTGQVRISRNSGYEGSPSWSADGTKLVFSYSPDNTKEGREIYSINSDGNGLKRLTNNSYEDDFPSLSRDGQFLTWSATLTSSKSAVFVAASDGSNPRNLTAAADESARTSSFDLQNRVVFAVRKLNRSGEESKYQIVRANPDGTGRVQLSAGNFNHYAPSVSPDGSTLVFTDDESGDFRLAICPVSSFKAQIVPSSMPGDSDPRWTPDGHLVFASARNGNSEIYVCNADGSSLRRLTNDPSGDRLPSAR